MSSSAVIHELENLLTEDRDTGLVFFGKATNASTMKVFAARSSYTPKIDPHYTLDVQGPAKELIVWFRQPSADPLYVFGPTGAGKTSLVKYLAAHANYPVFELTGHSRLEFPDLVGHLAVQNGNMAFQYGPLALAMKYGGICLVNELDLLDPATAAGLNTILDGSPLCIPENNGEIIVPHPMFRFVATANTHGGSDDTGLYQGTLRMSLAFMDRFQLCQIGYPLPEAEKALLIRHLGNAIPDETLDRMIVFANEVRAQFMGTSMEPDAIELTMSTRTLIRWGKLAVQFHPLSVHRINPIEFALERALLMRGTPATQAKLREHLQRIFPQTI